MTKFNKTTPCRPVVLINRTWETFEKELPLWQYSALSKPTRAAQMAAAIEKKLKVLGLSPEPKIELSAQDRETTEQIARRTILKAKLRSFAGD